MMAPPADEAKTILIAEDNEDNRIVYSAMLEHYGYRVVCAKNGMEIKALAEEERPDVILMDISLPGIDGWTATRHLKDDPATRDIPVIAITARTLPEDREKAEEVGCSGYLCKPVEPRRVLQEVQSFTGSGRR